MPPSRLSTGFVRSAAKLRLHQSHGTVAVDLESHVAAGLYCKKSSVRGLQSHLDPLRVACHRALVPSVATEHRSGRLFCFAFACPRPNPHSAGLCLRSLWMHGQRGQPSKAIADRSATRLGFLRPNAAVSEYHNGKSSSAWILESRHA